MGCTAGDSYGGRMVPTEAVSRCGTPPPPANPIDDPGQLAANDKWNECAFPNRPTPRSSVQRQQDRWDEYVDEVRHQAIEDCASDRGYRCSDAEIDLWVEEALAREAEQDHETSQDFGY